MLVFSEIAYFHPIIASLSIEYRMSIHSAVFAESVIIRPSPYVGVSAIKRVLIIATSLDFSDTSMFSGQL